MTILEYLRDHIVYLDGGMGTLLQAAGLAPGELPERWNLSRPEVIRRIQTDYYNAGSNVVSTNTFGANALKFDDEELTAIIRAAISHARAAREASAGTQAKFIALDVGPLGRLLQPYGDLAFEEAVRLYAKTIAIGAAEGVDLILIETMNDSLDTKAALLAAKETTDLPVFVSNAYGSDGKLMTGADPAAMIALLEGMGADAIGVNCSLGPVQLRGVVADYLRLASVPVLVKPNAGLPRSEDGRTVFDVEAADFAAVTAEFLRDGARLAGGCCGTTPAYIDALVKASAGLPARPVTDKGRTVISSYTHAVTFGEAPVLIGERINPTGKKRFKEALRADDIDYILGEGTAQQDKGVHVLDVNVGLPEIDEAALLPRVCRELQAIIDLPLQIDTTDLCAMEAALRSYNGKAMINSVNGKAEMMAAVFPLVKKYGGVLVCLTLDEDGIPATAEGRFAIAEKIAATAAQYGIARKDLIFDPLAMTVSADPNAARVTLQALRLIRERLGCKTILGVSNVSFGLPAREVITASFFTMALGAGLSAAIMNPNSAEMMKAWLSFRALQGLDLNCADYIAGIGSLVSAAPAASAPAAPAAVQEGSTDLQRAIVRGRREQAGALAAAMLTTVEPLALVQEQIVPALDIVGQGFEKKTMYLPQLLMSAEAAQAAFEQVRARLQAAGGAGVSRGDFVLATVKGDIHDIGKNIVHLLMENYGFTVHDLGKDVPPEVVVEAVQATHAPLVGLSALMTTTVPAMAETIRLLREQAPWAKVIVGGAVLTQEYADRIGADCYAKDAMASVRYAVAQCEAAEG